MAKLDKNHIGLTLGVFFAVVHAVWAIAVAVGIGASIVNFIFPLHFLDVAYSVIAFSIWSAIGLVVMAFISGYVCGWVFAAFWNLFGKK